MRTFTLVTVGTVATATSVKEHKVKDLLVQQDKCCTPLASFTRTPPKASWVCEKLRPSYESNWAACEGFTSYMDGLNFGEQDPTYEDSYTEEYRIEDRQKHIAQWFDYYCREGPNDQTSTDYGLPGDSKKGAGPDAAFPGFTDGEDKALWREQDDLHSQLFYHIQQSWFFCEHRAKKGIYTLEKLEDEAGQKDLEERYDALWGGFKHMFKEEIDPRRLFMLKFTRYNIHQNEFSDWALKPLKGYAKVYEEAEEKLGHSGDHNVFCDNFDSEKEKIEARREALLEKFEQGLEDIKAVGEQGLTSAIKWRDHVRAFDKADLREAMAFSRDAFNQFWDEQIKCYVDKHDEDEHHDKITQFREFARNHTLNLEDEASMLCNFNRIHNRVRYWQYVPLAETQYTKDACNAGFDDAMAARSKILKNEDEDPKYTWTTPANGPLAEEKVDIYRQKIANIVETLEKWEDLDEELYPKKGKTRTPVTAALSKVTKEAMDVYYWYHYMGQAAMDHHV